MADETSTDARAPGQFGFQSRAVLVGNRIDVAALGSTDRTGNAPLVVELIGSSLGAAIAGQRLSGDGLAVIFRYGAIVFFDVSPAAVNEYIRQLSPHIRQPYPSTDQETEVLDIRVEPTGKETVEGNTLVVTDVSREKLQLIADVLAKSVSLAHHERAIESQFERIEPFATNLDHWGRGGRAAQELLQHLGGALLAEHRVVAGARVEDSPNCSGITPNSNGSGPDCGTTSRSASGRRCSTASSA